MKYCKECKVHLNDKLTHCPLCGAHPTDNVSGAEFYEKEIEPKVDYPQLKLRGDAYQNFLRKKSLWLVFIVVVVSVFINIIVTTNSIWSAYVAISGVVVFLCLLMSLYRHRRFYSLLTLYAFVLPFAALAFDIVQSLNSVKNLSRIGISISYVCPAILLALLITCTVMAFSGRNNNKYYFTSTLFVALLSTWPQIAVWILNGDVVFWFSFALFCYAILTIAVVFIVGGKKVLEELRRKFYL